MISGRGIEVGLPGRESVVRAASPRGPGCGGQGRRDLDVAAPVGGGAASRSWLASEANVGRPGLVVAAGRPVAEGAPVADTAAGHTRDGDSLASRSAAPHV